MKGRNGRDCRALTHARKVRVGKVGARALTVIDPGRGPTEGRVVARKLPAPLAAKAERRVAKQSAKKGKRADPRSLEAAHFVMVFTTLPERTLSAVRGIELYRYRWQIELEFKRLKQLLKLG